MAKQKNFFMIHMMRFFKKPKWSFFLSQEQTQQKQLPNPNKKSGKTTDEKKKKTKKNKNYLDRHCCSNWLFIVYIDLAEKDDYWDYSASSEDVYPLKRSWTYHNWTC